jgi:hypothetical protein
MSGPEVKKAPYLEIEISARAAAAITRGQLWIFSNEIFQKPSDATMGSWCHFVVRKEFVAFGYFNPHSLIAGRVVSFKKEDDIYDLIIAFDGDGDRLIIKNKECVFDGDMISSVIINYLIKNGAKRSK